MEEDLNLLKVQYLSPKLAPQQHEINSEKRKSNFRFENEVQSKTLSEEQKSETVRLL